MARTGLRPQRSDRRPHRGAATNCARENAVIRSVTWLGGASNDSAKNGRNGTMMPNERSCQSYEGDWYGSNVLAANSEHPGGVNVGLADASVRFVVETINQDVWWGVHTINGAENVQLP